jgi:hypothetical protein
MPELEGKENLRDKLTDPRTLVVSDLKRLEKALDPDKLELHRIAQEQVGHRTMVLLRGAKGEEADETSTPLSDKRLVPGDSAEQGE